MSQQLDQTQTMTAIDALVEGRSDGFKVAVYELCRQQKWADDEPGIMLAIATGQLEMLVKQYPERISEAMAQATRELEGDWKKLQAKLAVSALKGTQTATQITNQLTDTRLLIDQVLSRAELLMKAAREAMLQAMADERAEVKRLLGNERRALEQQAMALAEQQKQVIQAQTQALIAEGVVASQRRAEQQVNQIVKGVRAKHFWETITVALLAAISILVVGWTGGLFLGRQPQLRATLETMGKHVEIQQVETGWLLEKANRAECFYGIKAQGDPQCQ